MADNTPSTRLNPAQLYNSCDPAKIPFQVSDEIKEPELVVGQDRALDAIHFGTRISGSGFNIFALGAPGTGKYSVVRKILEAEAKTGETPSDWCYVHNFSLPHKPNALNLPSGQAVGLRKDMEQLVEDLKTAIPAAFEADEYRAQTDNLEQELVTRRDTAFNGLAEQAKKENVQLIHTPTGFAFAPMDEAGEVVVPEAYEKLPANKKKKLEKGIAGLQKQLQKIIRQFPAWQKETHQKIKELDRQIARLAVGHLISVLHLAYHSLTEVIEYLNAVEEDIVEHVKDFQSESDAPNLLGTVSNSRAESLQRYQINVIVDHSVNHSAPVVYQDLPNHSNLIGRAEYLSRMGTLQTDFTLIKAGDLHRANGGYLILDARHLLTQPYAWESLKRALRSREIRIEPLERTLGLISTVSLDPEPIPLDIKVVLLGDHRLYYLLSQYDPEFHDLFKVAADFDSAMQRSDDNCAHFARLIARMAQQHDLKAIDNIGVSRLIEHATRMSGDSEKISTHLRGISDVLQEANYWAEHNNKPLISAEEIQQAIDQGIYRLDRVRAHIYEAIDNGVIKIDTSGDQIGQINGLSVLDLGGFSFGQPSRITANTRLGDGRVIDIERETDLGGSLHSKGVMILSSFLSSRYAYRHPLCLSASLVFEQSYGMVDGDSASLAELCVLLSSISETPIRQNLAVTGSVNQHGRVQAIGGVNQKIEGFYDVCTAKGLSGSQGVVIPASNIRHLMLRNDVVKAVAEQKFHVYGVESVDQAIELLTGVTAGERNLRGIFSKNTINGLVEQRLINFAELRGGKKMKSLRKHVALKQQN